MRIPLLTGILVFVVCLGIAAAFALFLLVALNGFPERSAAIALAVFGLGTLFAGLLSAVAGFLACRWLRDRGWRSVGAVLLPLAGSAVSGAAAEIVLFFAAVLAAEYRR